MQSGARGGCTAVDNRRSYDTSSPCVLHDFHRSHAPVPSAYSPCMHREDASTMSFSCIQVTNRSIELSYLPHSPCLAQASETHVTSPRFGLPGVREATTVSTFASWGRNCRFAIMDRGLKKG